MSRPSATQLAAALKAHGLPGGRQLLFLKAHVNAPGKALNAANLAKAAKYQDWRGINLQYGLLAESLGKHLGIKGQRLSLLMEFAGPRTITNKEWVLVMKPAFAKALRMAGWVK